jgi:hypothetical protein
VQNSGKSFRIPIVARLPRLAVKLAQSELSFGCCPVAEVSKATLRVENTGVCTHWAADLIVVKNYVASLRFSIRRSPR